MRREKIQWVLDFSGNLAAAVHRHYKGSREYTQAVSEGLLAECDVCGIPLTGQDLLLAGDATGTEVGVKVKRLRLGFCARDGCESYFYRLSLRPVTGLDWKEVLAHIETLREARKQAMDAEASAQKQADPMVKLKKVRKIAIAIGLVLMLLLIRQWYVGGTIPFIREPEKFHVSTAAPSSENAPDMGD